MLTQICGEIRNYFYTDDDVHPGEYRISGGIIAPLDFLAEGQYFRVIGSRFNDGVHQYPAYDLIDEEFTGAVCAMYVPPAFLELVDKIREYMSTPAANPSPYTSETYPDGYSYTVKDGGSSWTSVFRSDLRRWRKL